MPEPLRLKGIAASGGYAEGPLYPLHREEGSYLARGNPHEEAEALRAAIDHASARIGKLIAAASEESAAIL
jgi:phosphotransferase system enzyme I (PtsI)